MSPSTDTTYRHVQGLSRGLSILRALNETDSGNATPRELSAKTKLNRTTVKRILETLAEEGYVRPCDYDGSYGLAPEVLLLSSGISQELNLLHHASPVMRQLGEETGWSLRISTPQNESMVIRDSNHPSSSLSFESWRGLRSSLPILLTAAGRAYFANSDAEERSRIVEGVRRMKCEQTALANNDRLVEQLTRRVLEDGYAINDGDWGERRLGAVALPIRARSGAVVASLSMLYTRQAVSMNDIDNEFLPALRRSVSCVEAHL